MRLVAISTAFLSAVLSAAGCVAPATVGAGDAARAERARQRKVRRLTRDAQEAFATPDLDESQADEEAF